MAGMKVEIISCDSNGNINILTSDGNLVFSSVGTIDYQSGKISNLGAIKVLSIVAFSIVTEDPIQTSFSITTCPV